MLLDQVIGRLVVLCPDLGTRIEGAAELTALVTSGALPNVTPCAFVLPLGLRGGAAHAVTGLFRQGVDEVVGVVLIVEAPGSDTGAPALPTIDALVNSVIAAMCGWRPDDDAIGVFQLARGALLQASRGAVMYQLDFSIPDQLRIATT